jgi:L-asparaginase
MVSSGKKKKGIKLINLQHIKNLIKLTKEILLYKKKELENANSEYRGLVIVDGKEKSRSSGDQEHCQLHKLNMEKLVEK